MEKVNLIYCIRRRHKHNNQISVISTFNVEATPPTKILAPPFNDHIKRIIETGNAVAGCNISVKNNIMGAY